MNDERLKPAPDNSTSAETPEITFFADYFIANRASLRGDHKDPDLLEQARQELLEEGVLYINKRGKIDHKPQRPSIPMP